MCAGAAERALAEEASRRALRSFGRLYRENFEVFP